MQVHALFAFRAVITVRSITLFTRRITGHTVVVRGIRGHIEMIRALASSFPTKHRICLTLRTVVRSRSITPQTTLVAQVAGHRWRHLADVVPVLTRTGPTGQLSAWGTT